MIKTTFYFRNVATPIDINHYFKSNFILVNNENDGFTAWPEVLTLSSCTVHPNNSLVCLPIVNKIHGCLLLSSAFLSVLSVSYTPWFCRLSSPDRANTLAPFQTTQGRQPRVKGLCFQLSYIFTKGMWITCLFYQFCTFTEPPHKHTYCILYSTCSGRTYSMRLCSTEGCRSCWVGQTRHHVFVKRRQMEREEKRMCGAWPSTQTQAQHWKVRLDDRLNVSSLKVSWT